MDGNSGVLPRTSAMWVGFRFLSTWAHEKLLGVFVFLVMAWAGRTVGLAVVRFALSRHTPFRQQQKGFRGGRSRKHTATKLGAGFNLNWIVRTSRHLEAQST
jgi:hypothetical protein